MKILWGRFPTVPDLLSSAPTAPGRSGTCPTVAHTVSTMTRKCAATSGGQRLGCTWRDGPLGDGCENGTDTRKGWAFLI
jgi:hypothetical protein